MKRSMKFRLTPQDHVFYDLLAEAGRNVVSAGELLATLNGARAERPKIARMMKDYEHHGDSLTHNILSHLNKSFITPFDREDIYRLAGALDDVVDALDEVADFLDVADVGALPPLILDQIELVRRACVETGEAMGRLHSLADLEPYWIEVNRLENEADQVYRRLLSRLLSGDYDVLRMLKLREVGDLLEQAADALEHVAHAVQTIAVKQS
jgi:predicted phosphate transport protein (TIGR00153 family)